MSNFQKFRDDAKVKKWQEVHGFEKVQVAGIKLEAEQIKQENKNLNQEIVRMRRAIA